MRWPWSKKSETRLELEIDKILNEMEGMDKTGDEYKKLLKRLETLNKMLPNEDSSQLSANTVLTVAAYVVIGVAILTFEAFGHTITTRVGSLAMPKPRIG